jgi:hypothetical protein
VFTARRALSSYIKHIRSVFKGLNNFSSQTRLFFLIFYRHLTQYTSLMILLLYGYLCCYLSPNKCLSVWYTMYFLVWTDPQSGIGERLGGGGYLDSALFNHCDDCIQGLHPHGREDHPRLTSYHAVSEWHYVSALFGTYDSLYLQFNSSVIFKVPPNEFKIMRLCNNSFFLSKT